MPNIKKHLLKPKNHNKSFVKLVVFSVFAMTVSFVSKVQANFQGIQNPATGNLGNDPTSASSGEMFVSIFISLWNTAISVGAIITIVMFLWGALEWITASGDTGKVTKGQQKMLQAALGLFVLVSSFIIIGFVSSILFGTQFDILRPQFFVPGDGTPTAPGVPAPPAPGPPGGPPLPV